jgi:hypothetical protein
MTDCARIGRKEIAHPLAKLEAFCDAVPPLLRSWRVLLPDNDCPLVKMYGRNGVADPIYEYFADAHQPEVMAGKPRAVILRKKLECSPR